MQLNHLAKMAADAADLVLKPAWDENPAASVVASNPCGNKPFWICYRAHQAVQDPQVYIGPRQGLCDIRGAEGVATASFHAG